MAGMSDDAGRICELDASDNRRVLIWKAGQDGGFDEMNWSQKTLHEAAQIGEFPSGLYSMETHFIESQLEVKTAVNDLPDPSMRISRKKIDGMTLEIKQIDLYNEVEQEKYKDHANMANSLVEVKLGFFQKERHEYIYIISKKSGG